MKKVSISVLILLMIAAFTGYAGAEALTGNLMNGCLTAGGLWSSAATTFDWTITQQTNGLWRYSYEFDVVEGGITGFFLDLPQGFTDITNVSGGFNTQIGTFTTGSENPGLPCDFYGIAFLPQQKATSANIAFTSAASPAWGNFYARDGIEGDNFIYNTTFCDPNPTDAPRDGTIDCKTLRPGGPSAPVIPEASTLLLGAMGIMSFIAGKRRLIK